MTELKEGHVYVVSGGYFQAYRNPESGKWELWTWQGYSGQVIGRTGFEVDDEGNLYDRVIDFETGKQVVLEESSYSVSDLEEASGRELRLMDVHQTQAGLSYDKSK